MEGAIRGKKAAEFDIWAAAVEAMSRERSAARRLGLEADAELKQRRRYQPPRGRLRRWMPPRVMPLDSLAALRDFAAQHDGRLDALTYMAFRRLQRPDWPTRNTVARHFGSWHAALEAAGLAERAATNPGRHARRSRTIFDARRAEQRDRVLASVRRFVDEVGHVPRAMEYFRWRLARDPDTPTQATVYNLFPGGWSVVLAEMGA